MCWKVNSLVFLLFCWRTGPLRFHCPVCRGLVWFPHPQVFCGMCHSPESSGLFVCFLLIQPGSHWNYSCRVWRFDCVQWMIWHGNMPGSMQMCPLSFSSLNALAPTWLHLSSCGQDGSNGSSWVKTCSGALVDLRPCWNLVSLPMMVGTECSTYFLMNGEDRPGQVTNYLASIASQKVLTGRQPAAPWRNTASFFAFTSL